MCKKFHWQRNYLPETARMSEKPAPPLPACPNHGQSRAATVKKGRQSRPFASLRVPPQPGSTKNQFDHSTTAAPATSVT
ncbi:MAG: hypothetical protein RIT14_870 [Pseudomonadota bacterium]|jgi:hypothetical protein